MTPMPLVRRSLLALALAAPLAAFAQAPVTLHGAVQFADDHAFTKALVRFEELVKKYYGKPVNFVLHKNSSLGLEKDYFAYMNQGVSVDYAIVSPAHMSTFSKAAPFIDAPSTVGTRGTQAAIAPAVITAITATAKYAVRQPIC